MMLFRIPESVVNMSAQVRCNLSTIAMAARRSYSCFSAFHILSLSESCMASMYPCGQALGLPSCIARPCVINSASSSHRQEADCLGALMTQILACHLVTLTES